MFDPWIIEEIRRREEERVRSEIGQPALEIREPEAPRTAQPEGDGEQRGVVVIDFGS